MDGDRMTIRRRPVIYIGSTTGQPVTATSYVPIYGLPGSIEYDMYKSVIFLEEITKWVNDGSPVDVIYLDFQKALFDKVPHQ